MSSREKEKIPSIAKLIKNLNNKIFDEKFTLYREGEGRDMNRLKRDLENIFGKFDSLKNSDFVILNTYFNNQETTDKKNSLDQVLNWVTDKIINIVDNAIEDSTE